MNENICVVYTHSKLGDLIWQLPYIKALSEFHKKKITLIVRASTQAKKILRDLDHFEIIEYNNFRKSIYYWIDTYKLYTFLKYKNYSHLYVLDKVSRPAIAAKLAKIKNIIGPGIGNQKKWLTTKNHLKKSDWKLSYSELSQKIFSINNIPIHNLKPELKIDLERDDINEEIKNNKKRIISFGIDSGEEFKMWYEEFFLELANRLYEKDLFDEIFLVCGKNNEKMALKIMNSSDKRFFINCSNYNLLNIMAVIKKSLFFVGNNSGPLNMASALGIKSYGLISNDPISELKYSNIIAITPDNYVDDIWNRDREGMKNLTVEKVFNFIIDNLKTTN